VPVKTYLKRQYRQKSSAVHALTPSFICKESRHSEKAEKHSGTEAVNTTGLRETGWANSSFHA
jgi:hypothetical protein